MKRIVAFIKPHKLQAVTLALHKVAGMTGVSVTDGRGFGRLPLRETGKIFDFTPHVRLEIICEELLLEKLVDVIQKTAHTGLRGDGRIFVSPVERSIRISSGEQYFHDQ